MRRFSACCSPERGRESQAELFFVHSCSLFIGERGGACLVGRPSSRGFSGLEMPSFLARKVRSTLSREGRRKRPWIQEAFFLVSAWDEKKQARDSSCLCGNHFDAHTHFIYRTTTLKAALNVITNTQIYCMWVRPGLIERLFAYKWVSNKEQVWLSVSHTSM